MRKYGLASLMALVFAFACQQEENVGQIKSNVSFSLSPSVRSNGRMGESSTPAFALVSYKDSEGNTVQNTKLSLFAFGQDYWSEGLQLPLGNYQLTGFLILDGVNKIIYAAPLKDSELAKEVSHPLPLSFSITLNESTRVIPQVLAVLSEDDPAGFGYANFGFEVVQRKLKTMSNYYYEHPSVASEEFIFYYDDRGRLSSYDRYVPEGTRMIQSWHRSIEYIEGTLSRKITTRSVVDGILGDIIITRELHFDESNITLDRTFSKEGALTFEYTYTYVVGGYSVRIKRWMEEYKAFGITRIGYDTDEEGNITHKRIYSSHFESAGNVEEYVEREYLFEHNESPNPLYKLDPYFTDFTSMYRYADTESAYNVERMRGVGCDEYCDSNFSYQYQNGYVTEMTPGGLLLSKRTFEYY